MQPPDHLKGDLVLCCQRLFQSEKNNAAGGAGDLRLHLRSKWVQDHAQLLAILHLLPRLHEPAEDPARRGEHIGHLTFLHHRGQIPAVAVIAQQADPAEIPQHRGDCLLRAPLIDLIGLLGINTEGVCFPDLPIVVQGGRVNGLRLAHDHIGQAEQVPQAGCLIAGVHNAHMGHKIAGQIEGGKMDAVFVALHRLKQCRRNALGRFPLIVAREHPVDVRFVHGPEPASHIHGKVVDAGHHQQLIAGGNGSLLLQLPELFYQQRADIHLLHLVAAHGSHHGAGLFSLAKAEALDPELLAVGRFQLVKRFFSHFWNPPVRMRASRLPG